MSAPVDRIAAVLRDHRLIDLGGIRRVRCKCGGRLYGSNAYETHAAHVAERVAEAHHPDVDEIAEAICAAHTGDVDAWEITWDGGRETYRRMAEAALAAAGWTTVESKP